jgi:hypothetical protein
MFGGGSQEKCTNWSFWGCHNYATSKVHGVPVCDSCNVYSGNVNTVRGNRSFTVVTKR